MTVRHKCIRSERVQAHAIAGEFSSEMRCEELAEPLVVVTAQNDELAASRAEVAKRVQSSTRLWVVFALARREPKVAKVAHDVERVARCEAIDDSFEPLRSVGTVETKVNVAKEEVGHGVGVQMPARGGIGESKRQVGGSLARLCGSFSRRDENIGRGDRLLRRVHDYARRRRTNRIDRCLHRQLGHVAFLAQVQKHHVPQAAAGRPFEHFLHQVGPLVVRKMPALAQVSLDKVI